MCRYCHFDYQCCITFSVKSRLHDKFSFGSKIYSEKLDKYFSRRQKTETSWPSIFVSSMYIVCVHNTTSMRVFSVFLFVCLVQPRPQGFSLKKWVGLFLPHPFFEGKALGMRLCLVSPLYKTCYVRQCEHFILYDCMCIYV